MIDPKKAEEQRMYWQNPPEIPLERKKPDGKRKSSRDVFSDGRTCFCGTPVANFSKSGLCQLHQDTARKKVKRKLMHRKCEIPGCEGYVHKFNRRGICPRCAERERERR